MNDLIPIENIAQKIYIIRDQRVMLDSDLAVFYGVQTKILNKAVNRNIERFPGNFMFQLSSDEYKSLRFQNGTLDLRFQNGTSSKDHGGRRYLPYAFTEHGVVMLSSVLKGHKAAQVSIAVVNAFIKMREYLATHKQIIDKLKKHDENFVILFNVLKQLTDKPKEQTKKKQIGFRPEGEIK